MPVTDRTLNAVQNFVTKTKDNDNGLKLLESEVFKALDFNDDLSRLQDDEDYNQMSTSSANSCSEIDSAIPNQDSHQSEGDNQSNISGNSAKIMKYDDQDPELKLFAKLSKACVIFFLSKFLLQKSIF